MEIKNILYKVYCIYSNEANPCYIGMTKQKIRKRYNEHKYNFKVSSNKNDYSKTMRNKHQSRCNIIFKQTETPNIKCLADNLEFNEALKLENFFIDMCNSVNIKYGVIS